MTQFNIPTELRDRAIQEMQTSFGFSEGVEENFELTVELAVRNHRNFLRNLPDPTAPIPVPLSSFRPLPENRRKHLAATYAKANENVAKNSAGNVQFLKDQHRLRLITLFTIDSHLSTTTADQLAQWVFTHVYT